MASQRRFEVIEAAGGYVVTESVSDGMGVHGASRVATTLGAVGKMLRAHFKNETEG